MRSSQRARLDELLVARGLAPNIASARALIMAGKVRSGDRRMDKAGEVVHRDLPLFISTPSHTYASRGGLKLAAAMEHWRIQVAGLRCLDLGASTGGFTDCLLRRGAARVLAVDVGWNQLAYRLRRDPRVAVMERTDARRLSPETLGGPVDFACADLSFISLKKIFPSLALLLKPGSRWVALVKPQFEVARGEVPRGGVILEDGLRRRVLEEIRLSAESCGLGPRDWMESPIRGRQGNIEFLFMGQKI